MFWQCLCQAMECRFNNVILNNLSGLDLVRRSRSHVKGHRRGGVCVLRMLLVYTSTKSWRGYIFTAVCLCVCVSVCLSVCVCVCVWLFSCEQNSSRTDAPIWTRFSLNGCSDPIEISDLGSKVKVTVAQYSFFLHNSLLTSLQYISALVCLINLKFGIPL